jgi:chlorophyll/bacteriochlorophyll a synthase
MPMKPMMMRTCAALPMLLLLLVAVGTRTASVRAFPTNVVFRAAPSSSMLSPVRMLPNSKQLSEDNSDRASRATFYPFPSSKTDALARKTASASTASSTTTQLRMSESKNKEAQDGSSGVRQLLGVKGASAETNIWKIRLQLTKPVTWVPLVWGVMCGAAASGNYHWMWNPFDPTDRDVFLGLEDAAKGFVAMILAGPFLTGYTQCVPYFVLRCCCCAHWFV